MGLKQRTIDIIDHIFIAIFVIGQAGLAMLMLNNLFNIIALDYTMQIFLSYNFGLVTVNFFLLLFAKIFLLLERKTA